jgi:alanine-glyoxylate transaminase/serine-glyoxylate transaminase/serine-pyruvate transaminase
VLAFETGHFATLWRAMAERLGLEVVWVPGDWRHGADPERAEATLRSEHGIAAVMAVHNETSTGVTSRIPEIRAAIDAAGSDALLLVDTISSLGSIDHRHDEWGVDVTVGGSQKGLMLPAGLGFNAVSEKALAATRRARLPRSYWDWEPIIAANASGYWPYTSATNLLYGLREALAMLQEEGLENVFARHARHAAATRAAVRAWGLEVLALDEREYSGSLTAVLCDESDEVRRLILERFDMSLGAGVGQLAGKVFRIGHLGDFNDLMLAGTLCGVEMGLRAAGVEIEPGVGAALELLEAASVPA